MGNGSFIKKLAIVDVFRRIYDKEQNSLSYHMHFKRKNTNCTILAKMHDSISNHFANKLVKFAFQCFQMSENSLRCNMKISENLETLT